MRSEYFLVKQEYKRAVFDTIQRAENDFGYEKKTGIGRLAEKSMLKTMFDQKYVI